MELGAYTDRPLEGMCVSSNLSVLGRVCCSSPFKVTVHHGGRSWPQEHENVVREKRRRLMLTSLSLSSAHGVVKPEAVIGLPPPNQLV